MGRALLGLWAPLSVVLVALVMSSHVLALPLPAARAVERALRRVEGASNGWVAYHVLYAGCPCSRRVADALGARGALTEFEERVLLVGHDAALAKRLETAHFVVTELSADELLTRYGVEAVPVFFAVAPDGSVRYLGGYASRSGAPPDDARVLGRVRQGERPDPLPVFGCATSRELQRAVDPLGVKYPMEQAQ